VCVRAIRFDGEKAMMVGDMKEPVAAPGEAIVRTHIVGICATDLEVLRGGTRFVGTMGHEFVGTVVSINLPKDASAVMQAKAALKGRRVVADINIVCGKCDMCRSGLKSHCRNRAVLGCSGRDGCFTEFFSVPLANLHAVPDSVDNDQAVFAEPLASAAHVTQMLRPESKAFITVLGDGKLGLLTAQVLGRNNPAVRLLGKHPEKYGLCEKWGVKHRHIDEVGRRMDQDVVVDCTGSASGLALAMQLVRPRGKIIVKSTISPLPIQPGAPVPGADHPAWREPLNLAPIVINEIDLVGSRCGPVDVAVGMLERGEVNVLPLITARFPFTQGLVALEAAKRGQVKVLLEL